MPIALPAYPRFHSLTTVLADSVARLRGRVTRAEEIPVQQGIGESRSAVDDYWAEQTVNSVPFKSARESLAYLDWRFDEYPLFRELMDLYGDHAGETVIDYGCGPGNDLVGFLEYSAAAQVIGVDVSEKALNLARHRLALHRVDPARLRLIQITDADSYLPVTDCSVDHVYCEGVLQHTSSPEKILAEFYRVLRPGACSCIMVYNRHSIWRNLYTAYVKMILEGEFAGLTLDEAFARNTDGPKCPLSRNYAPESFSALCMKQGFTVEYRGGYLCAAELECLDKYGQQALADPRLSEEIVSFLRNITKDDRGFPMYRGKHAGVGGVYLLQKPR
jgi:SAM-dependent methyltransferase